MSTILTRSNPRPHVHSPASAEDAARVLAELGTAGEVLAGGTWILRSQLRGEQQRSNYVSLHHLPELRQVHTGENVTLGAMLTHTDIAETHGGTAFSCVAEAARTSAFPQVRNTATLSGNIATTAFAEADLVPALLAADAEIELCAPSGFSTLDIQSYLASRANRPLGELITRVSVPTPATRRSTFERLTVRATGEYAIANVAVSVDVDEDEIVRHARIAVGSVEPVARLCESAATELIGHSLSDDAAIARAGTAAAEECTARDGLDAPGWYRLAVLPTLISRAARRIERA
ncbi:FAD binding domain-containing protein [Haloechinothrix salitolerans]|uniref:FAD binding domain-containing protein n=1 Tax=Haloechinothrix salitolerans TaxID=926830 RepID=A0ABW2BWE0_9PSEU